MTAGGSSTSTNGTSTVTIAKPAPRQRPAEPESIDNTHSLTTAGEWVFYSLPLGSDSPALAFQISQPEKSASPAARMTDTTVTVVLHDRHLRALSRSSP